MKHRDPLFDRIIARIKNNPVAATLIAAGTVVIALSTFSDATRNLIGLAKSRSPENARLALSNRSVPYTREAFLESVKRGDAQAVDLFLTAGIDPNMKDDEGDTPLMRAIAGSRTEIVKALLKAKADVNEKNDGGATALDWAAARGQMDTVRLLLDEGANAQAINQAFVSAAENGHSDVMRALLEKGAKLNEVGSKALLAAARSTVIGVVDQKLSDAVRLLISLGTDVNAKDADGWTPLLLAADREGAGSVVQSLLDGSADVNVKCGCPGYLSGGWTALMIASREGRSEIVKRLLAKRADVNLRNNAGKTALALAATRDDVGIVRALLDAGADVNAHDNDGRTPLMQAASGGNVQVAHILLQRGARVADKDLHGKNAMQLADTEAKAELVRLLSKNPRSK